MKTAVDATQLSTHKHTNPQVLATAYRIGEPVNTTRVHPSTACLASGGASGEVDSVTSDLVFVSGCVSVCVSVCACVSGSVPAFVSSESFSISGADTALVGSAGESVFVCASVWSVVVSCCFSAASSSADGTSVLASAVSLDA